MFSKLKNCSKCGRVFQAEEIGQNIVRAAAATKMICSCKRENIYMTIQTPMW